MSIFFPQVYNIFLIVTTRQQQIPDMPNVTADRRHSAPPSKHELRTSATRNKILDSAEALFARDSVNSVSLRQITARAGVDLALVKYHFGPKQALFDAVIIRRARVLRQRREAVLAETLSAAAEPPSLEAVIGAYIHPLLDKELLDDAGWHNYFTLIARLINTPEPPESGLADFFDPMIDKYVAALRLALPGVSDADLYWCCHFMSGTLAVTFADTDRLDRVSGGQCRIADKAGAAERLVPFLASGFRAVCQGDASDTPQNGSLD